MPFCFAGDVSVLTSVFTSMPGCKTIISMVAGDGTYGKCCTVGGVMTLI